MLKYTATAAATTATITIFAAVSSFLVAHSFSSVCYLTGIHEMTCG